MLSTFYGKCKEFLSSKTFPSATVNDSKEQIIDPQHITSLECMGFQQCEVLLALREARGNVDVALEYLLTGLPNDSILQASQE